MPRYAVTLERRDTLFMRFEVTVEAKDEQAAHRLALKQARDPDHECEWCESDSAEGRAITLTRIQPLVKLQD